MTIQQLKAEGLILLECISGSKAYGLDTPESDTDIKGVFYLPKSKFYGLEYIEQVSNESNDEVYYELGRFITLLTKNNPNIIELLNTPDDCILYKHPVMDEIKASMFISKLCKQTFGNYAMTQVKKARGLNKKIVNPVEERRKSVLEFCYVPHDQGSQPVSVFLEHHGMQQEFCGLSKLPNMHEVYGLYYSKDINYKGIVRKDTANDIALSSIPKGEQPVTFMTFNKSGYSAYCKTYKEYWEWVAKRNDVRYRGTVAHGKNYDAKNMMHTFRLLTMAQEIGETGEVNVRRHDRDFLLAVKSGDFEYEALVRKAEGILEGLESIYAIAALPAKPDEQAANDLLVKLREALYQ